MLTNVALLATTASLLLAAPSHAWWIIGHSTLTRDRLDPIISAGAVSSHVHTVVGASNFGPSASNYTLRKSSCTTSPVQADMSSYWAPQLYHQNLNNGTKTLIPADYVNTYYLQRGGPSDPDAKNISAFPAGLRMIAGSPFRTTYNASNQADAAINFVCLNYQSGSSQATQFPTTNCANGLRAQVIFPSCWDGVNLDSPDHKSHMAYPLGTSPDNGDCPGTHPNKLITLFHEWVFGVGNFDYVSGQNNWVFSYGDETGLGFHADFMNGWDVDVLQKAIDQCTSSLFDNVEGCPPLASSVNRPLARSCTIDSVVEEDIIGPLTALPGCNPIPVTVGATCTGLVTPAIKGLSGAGAGAVAGAGSSASTSASTSASMSASTSAWTSAWTSASASAWTSADPSAWTSAGSSAWTSAWTSPSPSPSAWTSADPSAGSSAWTSAWTSPSPSPSAWTSADPSAWTSAWTSASPSTSAWTSVSPSAWTSTSTASASASSVPTCGMSSSNSTTKKRKPHHHHRRRNHVQDVSS